MEEFFNVSIQRFMLVYLGKCVLVQLRGGSRMGKSDSSKFREGVHQGTRFTPVLGVTRCLPLLSVKRKPGGSTHLHAVQVRLKY